MEAKRSSKRHKKKVHEHEKSSTNEGTSVKTKFMQSRRDSGFGDIVSEMISTPVMKSSVVNRRQDQNVNGNPSATSQTKASIFRSVTSGFREPEVVEVHEDPAP